MTWLLMAVLVMIWAAFLLPSRRRSPTASVEEFEERMNLLAEANRTTPGRWVLMPRKGQPFLDPRDRRRARVRRRRRQVFVGLVDVTGFALLMGLFPPFRVMLAVGAVLAVVLAAYCMVLLKIRADEERRARLARSARARYQRAYGSHGPDPYREAVAMVVGREDGHGHPNGNGNGNGHHGNGNGNGHANGNGNEHAALQDLGDFDLDQHALYDTGVTIIEDDVHVVLRRSDEIDLDALREAR